ncbi:MAG: cytochrome c3 family protein [Anaeromyxobacteraceae bacterium]
MAARCVLLLLLAACAGSPRRGPEPVSYPAAEVAAVKDVHAYRGRPLCQGCHAEGSASGAAGALQAAPNALCARCHTFVHGTHPVDVEQKEGAEGLPLAGRRVVCHTCHDPHAVKPKAALRLAYNDLCTRCHLRQHHVPTPPPAAAKPGPQP